jgi:hypothetical protein
LSTPEPEALLEQAIDHVNAGELEQGRALLERVLEQDPKNDRAWVWLSGCVEEPMQRRICLQQALSANPNNQAALDGMDMLDGKLVQASEVPPSLLESRLSAIGMGDRPPTVRPAPASSRPPSPEVATIAPIAPPPTDIAWEEEMGETSEQPGRRRIVLLVAVVLFLFLVVCILVAATVVPPLLKGF